MSNRTIRIATRGSALALAQATLTEAALKAADPGIGTERVIIKTTGDRQSETGAPEAGKGVFVKEIQDAVLKGAADLAVHSLKDLPVEETPGLRLVATLEREDVRDAFCGRDGRTLDELPDGAKIATGSPRRAAQLKRLHARHHYVPIRGNVDTRLRKIREGEADGVILARAGLARLGLLAAVTELIPVAVCLPAPGQGAVGLECRDGDEVTSALLDLINHPETLASVTAERAFLKGLGGGCRTPIAAWGKIAGGTIELFGFASDPEGKKFIASALTGPADEAEILGEQLAERFLDQGAGTLLEP